MKYFYLDQNQAKIGPYTEEELRQLHLSGIVRPDSQITSEGNSAQMSFQEFWSSHSGRIQRSSPISNTRSFFEEFTSQTREDLRSLIPHLLVPFQEIRSLRWLENKKLLSIAAIGLFPLMIIALYADRGDIKTSYWALAFYFSVWWAMFFYNLFPAPQIEFGSCLIAFFGTGVVSIGLLLPSYIIPPLNWLHSLTISPSFIEKLLGYIFGVGIPEETCKALVLFFLLMRAGPLPPQSVLFYGLMSGLGFGIYEGVSYQMGRNVTSSGGNMNVYYLSNLIRLTSLPFLHAIWTGIAGYFVGFAWLYPRRKRGLLIVAVGVPALLHGVYDAFEKVGRSFIALAVALLSVMALYLYLAKSVDFEKALAGQKTE